MRNFLFSLVGGAILVSSLSLAVFSHAAAQSVTSPPRSIYLAGKVKFADGKNLPDRVVIERVCNGLVYREGYSDSRGDFGLQVGAQNASTFLDASAGFDKSPVLGAQGTGAQTGLSERDLAGCEIRANVPGYLSDSITLGFRRALDNPFIGTIYLHAIVKADSPVVSVEPYKQLVMAAVAQGNWSDVARHTSQMFKVTPEVGAEFYFYSAVANYNLQNLKVSEEHAREAVRRDPQHQNPKANLFLGVFLTEKREFREAAEQLRVYLQANPAASDAAAVRQQLATLENSGDLKVNWIHGSDPCVANKDNAFQVHAYNDDTYILREDKCINYEGPFIYLLFGQDKVFMQDTGAAPRADSGIAFPIRETVQRVIDEWSKKHGKTGMQLVVTHSHAHGDHTGGDAQFKGQPNTVVVGTKVDDVKSFFGVKDWPNEQVTLDLGGRVLDILPIPGHEASSVAVYDRKSKLLLTGDTVYPGRLYVRDWPVFKASIERLAVFVKTHEVSHVLGTHIEMSNKPGVDYPVRTTFQPEEHTLEMTPANILELDEALLKMGDTPVRDIHKDFIVYPR